MARLATNRDTYLERDEIAVETLRQFDAGGDVSIRQLASALQVSPAAIYHHFDSRDEIIQAAVALVWNETFETFFASRPQDTLVVDDPVEFLVDAAVVARRTFLEHYQIARFITVTPTPEPRLAGGLAMMGSLFERMGLRGERAGEGLFAYATFALGSIVLTASRRYEDAQAEKKVTTLSTASERPSDAPEIDPETSAAVDRAVFAPGRDEETEEAYFISGLRALLSGLIATS